MQKKKILPTYLPYIFSNRYRKQTIFFSWPHQKIAQFSQHTSTNAQFTLHRYVLVIDQSALRGILLYMTQYVYMHACMYVYLLTMAFVVKDVVLIFLNVVFEQLYLLQCCI